MPLFLYSRCPKPVQIYSLGTGTRLSHAQTSQIADYLARLIISQLEQVVTKWNAISWFIARLFTHQSVYFYISTAVGIINPVEIAPEATNFQHNLWENHDLTVQPITTYSYLCGRIYASCLSYFSNFPSGIEQKLNWNVTTKALQKIYHWHFTIYSQLVLSPFQY